MKGGFAAALAGVVLANLSVVAVAMFAIRRRLAERAALQKAYDDLRHSQHAMLQQERLSALGQMASGIAHDISNAISPVTLYTEALLTEEPGLSPRGRRNLEAIRRAVGHVAQTVARMREFYREREPQLVLLPVDLNELVRQVIELTRVRWSDMAQRQDIVIDVRAELAPDLPAILGSESELRDALVNLIFNAIDAMPNGGLLAVRTRLAEQPASDGGEPKRFVLLEVADSGIGMDDDTRRRCMEPFFTTKGDYGTGLGLAMVYGAMQRHGSDIAVESALGEGTTLRFSFPVPPADAMKVVSEVLADVPSLDVLVIDDDALVSVAMHDTLVAEGHRVVTSDGGQAGIDAFRMAHARGGPFQVVITDLGMPDVDGRKVAAAIKALEPRTVVVLLTGWGQTLVAGGEMPPHVDYVLSKPPARSELRAALASAEDPAAMKRHAG